MKQRQKLHQIRGRFLFSWRDSAVTLEILLAAYGVCSLLRNFGESSSYASLLFLLAVFLVARYTEGYFYGIAASLVGVLSVNYVFIYPYYSFNFTLAGYPMTMLCMLAVSLTTSALITRIKQSDQLKLAAEKEKMRGNLLRAVSHDLRTPLTSILGATSAVAENDLTLTHEERVRLLRGAQDDIEWLIRMVENLLAVTRIDADSPAQVIKTPEAAEEIVSETVAKFKKRFPGFSVSVRVPDALLMIQMDDMLIEQVLINLMENVVLHGETADRVELTVSRSGKCAVFEVRDNGVGIPPDKLPKILEGSMISAEEKQGDSKRNMGIGLSVCNAIVRAHGGSMFAENAPEGGAVIGFRLAIQEGEDG